MAMNKVILVTKQGFTSFAMAGPEICPYKHEPVSSQKGYFSAKIESVRKDVECVFGIIKKRWRILDYGIRF